ncbi:MAG TPA: PadR family transcriptional regulator [Gaiellaceae bacterium]|jgi:DNA-binding PadR family transcriptional regulator
MARTSTTANAVLGLLALRTRWSTWELATQLRRNLRFFWPRAESRVYDVVKELAAAGSATAEQSFTGRRARTTYAITPAGRKRLRAWLAQPPRRTTLECEAVLRILLADLCTHEQLLTALDRVRADADAIQDVGRIVAAEYTAGAAPFQDDVHARALVFDFLWTHAEQLRAWADRAEERIARWPAETRSERAEAGVASIARRVG